MSSDLSLPGTFGKVLENRKLKGVPKLSTSAEELSDRGENEVFGI